MKIKRSAECDMYVGGGFEPRLIDMPDNWQFDESVKSIAVIVTWEEELELHTCEKLQNAGNQFALDDDGWQMLIFELINFPAYLRGFEHCPYCGKELEVFDMD